MMKLLLVAGLIAIFTSCTKKSNDTIEYYRLITTIEDTSTGQLPHGQMGYGYGSPITTRVDTVVFVKGTPIWFQNCEARHYIHLKVDKYGINTKTVNTVLDTTFQINYLVGNGDVGIPIN